MDSTWPLVEAAGAMALARFEVAGATQASSPIELSYQCVNRGRKATAYGMRDGHANHGANAGCRPGGVGEERRWDRGAHAVAQHTNKGLT